MSTVESMEELQMKMLERYEADKRSEKRHHAVLGEIVANLMVENSGLKKELAEAKARIAELEKSNETGAGQIAGMRSDMIELERENANLKARIAELEKSENDDYGEPLGTHDEWTLWFFPRSGCVGMNTEHVFGKMPWKNVANKEASVDKQYYCEAIKRAKERGFIKNGDVGPDNSESQEPERFPVPEECKGLVYVGRFKPKCAPSPADVYCENQNEIVLAYEPGNWGRVARFASVEFDRDPFAVIDDLHLAVEPATKTPSFFRGPIYLGEFEGRDLWLNVAGTMALHVQRKDNSFGWRYVHEMMEQLGTETDRVYAEIRRRAIARELIKATL